MEILQVIDNSKEIYWVYAGIGAVLFTFISTLIGYISLKKEDKSMFLINIASLIWIFIAIDAYQEKDVKEYKVLIHDMKQFDTSKYKIVKQEGKIFHIEEINKTP